MAYDGPGRLGLIVKRVFGSNERAMRPFQLPLRVLLHLEVPARHWANDLELVHPYNVIIHPDAQLGSGVTIYHNDTIATVLRRPRKGTPVIGDNVTIYPNSVVMGNIEIGDGAVVGAGSIVIHSIPVGGVVAGNPARLVNTRERRESENKQ